VFLWKSEDVPFRFIFFLPRPNIILITYFLHGAESFLRSQLVLKLVKKFHVFLENESSKPYSQVPASCPYPEPTPSSPRNPLPSEHHLHSKFLYLFN